jgi:hypothetical protein
MSVLGKDQKPVAASGFRIAVLPDPPREESQIIIKPDDQKMVPHTGVLFDAGLIARDKLYDNGHELGDRIWYGKFAGVMEEWDRILECEQGCEHTWRRVAETRPHAMAWECDHCNGKRRSDLMLILNVDDILGNVDLQRRIESGKVAIKHGKTPDGRTQHFIDRMED